MSDDQQEGDQQTRVIFANGQTLILEGDPDDESINDENADILQQALQDASDKYTLGENSIVDSSVEYADDPNETMCKSEPEPYLAVLQGDQGETHTIQLTAEQARALGIHFTSDGDQREIPELSISNSESDNLQLSGDMSQMVYSDGEQNEEVMFETEDMPESIEMENGQIIEATNENLDALTTSMNGFITGNGGQLTLIPQFIDGQMTYTVKIPDELQDASEQFTDDLDVPVSSLSVLEQSSVTYHDITSIARASPNTSTTLSSRTVMTPIQSSTQCSRINSAVTSSLLSKKKPNVSYVDVPTRSLVTNIESSQLASQRVALNNNKSSIQTGVFRAEPANSSTVSSVTKLSSVPITTQSKVYSKLKGYSTTVTPVANKTTSTFVPLNSGKFTNVLASEGKLISGPMTKSNVSSKQISSELSAALTKMPIRTINKSKPLGSSENPIQLVQHGQTFHSVQSLNSQQLKQIATVLQRQHLESPPKATKNVIYNAETNTRIIYRVVYPEDLDLKEAGANKTNLALLPARGRGSGRRGRPPKSLRGGLGRADDLKTKSGEMDDDDRLNDDPIKLERKKQVARTRSGRVSRPPRHMVKDYKRLHHLDFAEPDLDDSDGGYSDYQMAEDKEGGGQKGADGEKELLSGLVSSKRNISSHFRCPTCQKIYLGHTRMARHFEMNPDHGSIPDPSPVTGDETVTPPEDMPPVVKVNGVQRTTQSGRGRGKRRGPWAYVTPEARSDRRKNKLREVLSTCEAIETSEVAGPLVAGSLSLWDLLLLRVDAVRAGESYASTMCDELGALIEKVRSVAGDVLKPPGPDQEEHVELQDEAVCAALGVPCGRYLVDDSALKPVSASDQNKRFKSSDADSPACPEVLSALTLVAKKPTQKTQELTTNGGDLKIVDDIVNERLENLDYVANPITTNVANPTDIEAQATNLINSLEHFQSNESKSVWEKEKVIHSQFAPNTEGFDPEIALAAMGEGDQTEHFGTDLSLSRMEGVENSGEMMLSNDNNADREVYDPEMELVAMGEGEQNVGTEFDPEMALAAMGEGEPVTFDPEESLMEEEDIEYQSTVNSSSESYDPEIALAAMGEGDQSEIGKVERGLELADVSLDESGPELDFEALSEEFNRNTRHNS